MELRGAIVTLKELQEEYFDEYIAMFSSVIKEILHVTDEGCERSYLWHCLEQHRERQQFFFCIFDNVDNRIIGAISVRSPNDSRGQLGSWLNEAYWGGGRYQEALALILEAYFERSGVQNVTAHIDVANVRSYKAHKKFGFIDAGIIHGPYGQQYVLLFPRPARAA